MLQPYQGALEGMAVVLKLVKAGSELGVAQNEYRVLQVTVRR